MDSSCCSLDTVLLFRMSLLNVRSLLNKTFILRDVFTHNNLDILFMTETSIKDRDLSPFNELVPVDCSFFNTPRISGHGGGIATVFIETFKGRIISSEAYNSFELQMFKFEVAADSVTFVIICRPPQPNSSFLNEFAEFLGGVVTKFEMILLLGDFNIHICCPNKMLPRDFCNLMDSLNFIQWVQGPTHTHGHTLDMVFTYGFSILDIQITHTGFSDHKSISFTASLPWRPVSTAVQTRWTRYFTANTVVEFASAYTSFHPMDALPWNPNVDEYLCSFNDKCLNILNSVQRQSASKKNLNHGLMTRFVQSDKYAY